jgi:hypothetical protein
MAIGTLGQLQGQAKESISQAAQPGISFATSPMEAARATAQATTGKESTGIPGAATASLTADLAQLEGQKQQQQVQQQAKDAELQQQQKEEESWMQLKDQELDVRNQAIQVKQNFNSKVAELIADFKNRGDELDIEKQKSQIDQISQLTRISDDKYVTSLKLEGARSRLQNKTAFAEAAMKSQFENQLQLIEEDFDFKSLLRADERTFKLKLENMGLAQSLSILDNEMSAARKAQMYKSIGSGVETGIATWEKLSRDKKETT